MEKSMNRNVNLSAEFHEDWRECIQEVASRANLDIALTIHVTRHEESDDVGEASLT